ncbi:MAG: GNAT family N-acetyltransferase [Betaproteobacteria bacterium]
MNPFCWSPFRSAHAVARLFDGRPLWIGPVTLAAKPLIVRGLERISPETSRRRFFTVRHRFSEQELEAMTNLDGHQRFALGATVRAADGDVDPVGVARFVRLADAPTVAEVAILVIDAFQGQGVGRVLLKRLATAALARGISRFRGVVLPENKPIIRLLTRHAANPAIIRGDEYLTIDVDLTAARGT